MAFHSYAQGMFSENGSSIHPVYSDLGATPHLKRGLEFAEQGMYLRAIGEWQVATRRAPDFQEAHFLLGAGYYALGQKREARLHWRDVLATNGPAVPNASHFGPPMIMIEALRFYESM
jgi:tetratricopeptide (TPR) repeat protein